MSEEKSKFRALIGKINAVIEDLVSDREDPDEPIYDPLHVGAMVVVVIFILGVLYWLLWSLLVFEGGLFVKIAPFFRVIFTKATLQDFGYEGYPYELGVFEGWIANLASLVLLIVFAAGIAWVFKGEKGASKI